ncbi:MAG: hypothetical protein E7290_05100 [Lachnospiraceae bacterium]|nr:hypothetical protein [Lachnospiraceae bacterium]
MQIKRILSRILVAFLIFIAFFVIGFAFEWTSLTKEHQKCINKEFSNYEDKGGPDLNEMYLEIHDNYSTAYKMEFSFYGGLLIATIGTAVSSYIYLLYKLFSSKDKKKINIGFIIIAVTLVCLCYYFYFVTNFELVF